MNEFNVSNKILDPAKVEIIADYVLIKATPVNDHVNVNGTKLFIDPTFEPDKHVTVCGEVIRVPKKLRFSEKYNEAIIGWETDMEIQVGDTAYFDFHSMMMSLGRIADKLVQYPDEKYIVFEGEIYVFISYGDIFCVVRDEKVIPVNGYALITPGIDEMKTFLELPYHLRIKESRSTGKIFAVGKCNRRYINPAEHDADPLNVGDNVFFKKSIVRKLEYDLHATLPKGLIVVQRKYIYASIKDSE